MADLGAVGLNAELEIRAVRLLDIGASPALTKIVSGVITDDANAVAARTVRVYARASGRLVGETISDGGTGEYEIDCPDEEVQRIVLDDDSGSLYNDIIDRVLPGP